MLVSIILFVFICSNTLLIIFNFWNLIYHQMNPQPAKILPYLFGLNLHYSLRFHLQQYIINNFKLLEFNLPSDESSIGEDSSISFWSESPESSIECIGKVWWYLIYHHQYLQMNLPVHLQKLLPFLFCRYNTFTTNNKGWYLIYHMVYEVHPFL